MSERVELRSLSLGQLEELVRELGEKPFRARQIFRWLHRRGVGSVAEMSDLSAALREQLAARTTLARLEQDLVQESADGTLKYRLRADDGALLEAVFMPDEARRTLCVSTQVGCAMGCAFCRTATMGLVRDLGPGEIVGQVHAVEADLERRGWKGDREHGRVLTNLVFMGMGEPLRNLDHVLRALSLLLDPEGLGFSHRHVTVSTSGLVPEIERFGRETQVKLAISLNGTTDEQRERLMPVNRKYPLEALLAACRAFPQRQGRRLTFEYVLLGGVNDADEDAERLAGLVRGVEAKVNLIAYNENPGLGFASPAPERLQAFRELLVRRGVPAMVRKNRGRDILGACGQLASASGLRRRPPPAAEGQPGTSGAPGLAEALVKLRRSE